MSYEKVTGICHEMGINPPSLERFNTNLYNKAPPRRGVNWSYEEEKYLMQNAPSPAYIRRVAANLMRDFDAVEIRWHRLSDAGAVPTKQDVGSNKGEVVQSTKEETEMKSPLVETKTFVNGQDVAHTHAEDLLKLVVTLESQINELKSIKTESKFVTARIESKQTDLAAVVALLDTKV